MHTTKSLSDSLVADVVRRSFGVEPDTMAALAHGDEQVRERFEPDAEPTTDPLDGVDVFVRRTVALAMALCNHPGPVMFVTEQHATVAGWPGALLANRCISLAWGLFVATQPKSATPLLLKADEGASDAMVALIRVDKSLPDLDDLLAELNRQRQLRFDTVGWAPVSDGDVTAVAHAGVVSVERLAVDWFGVNVDAIDLPMNVLGTRAAGSNARAVIGFKWLITAAIELGTLIDEEDIPAIRLKTEEDARLAGEPGAAMANTATLLALAIRHAQHLTIPMLPARDDLAAAVIEAGQRARARRLREGEDREAMALDLLELQDLAARGYVHVGRAAAREVAWRQIRGDA